MTKKFILLAAALSASFYCINAEAWGQAASPMAKPCKECHNPEPGVIMGFTKNLAYEARLIQLDLTTGQEIIRFDHRTVLNNLESFTELADCRDDGIKIKFIADDDEKLATEITGFKLTAGLTPAAVIPDKNTMARIIANPEVNTYDLRSESEFARGHLPGAMPLPASSFEKFSFNLPNNRETPVVLYGDSDCLDHAAFIKAEKSGYRDVRIYLGGYQDWTASDYVVVATDWLEQAIADKIPHILIDLRPTAEIVDGHIKGAVAIAPADLDRQHDRFPTTLDAPIILYGPGRKGAAAKIISWGYRQVGVLAASFEGWQAISNQVAYGPAATAIAFTPEPRIGTITGTEFNKLANLPDGPALFIDVREPVEFYTASVPGAVNLPLTELNGKIGELPADREIILYSNSGARAAMAHAILDSAGLANRYLHAAITFTASGFEISGD
ncbi:MAG: rhodanese-like domain-containing protein [Desulfurivibrionaceae bacterium]|nr:rhodanese-like domain-containing protein [Desulfurivibrionaceae bacterium]